MSDSQLPVAVVTGASSGIGAATATALAAHGFSVVLGARRLDRLAAVAGSIGPTARALPLDVSDPRSVSEFAAAAGECSVLVANAGGALGLDRLEDYDEAGWSAMWQANVMGFVRSLRAFLPALRASGDGRLVVITSVAGHQVYPGGAGYAAAKHAAAAVVETARLELLGEPIRVIEICPGLVRTEFSSMRFDGDEERAAAVYEGVTPLSAQDVADAVVWAVTRPPHVTVARIDLLARAQASARDVARDPS